MRTVLSTIKVGFDLDGVLARTEEAAICFYRDRGLIGPDVTAEDITEYDFAGCIGVDEKHRLEMFASPAFYEAIVPDAGGRGVLEYLMEAGADVHIVTARPFPALTAQWLGLHSIPYSRLVFASKDEKPYYAERHGLDFFFEDHPKTAARLASKVQRLSFLLSKPYNQTAPEVPNLVRFYTWNEIHSFFRL